MFLSLDPEREFLRIFEDARGVFDGDAVVVFGEGRYK